MKSIRIGSKQDVAGLEIGQQLLLTGSIYTARDQAHKRLINLIRQGVKLPFSIKGKIIYYCGATATPEGRVIGSCGPTTSARMDPFVLPLLKQGMVAAIGKGQRSPDIARQFKKYGVVYLVAPSGCGALLAEKVISKERVCFPDLGPEAIYKLEVKDFPLIVAIDSKGRDLYQRLNCL
jgi:fumarate hydratase subunit beta